MQQRQYGVLGRGDHSLLVRCQYRPNVAHRQTLTWGVQVPEPSPTLVDEEEEKLPEVKMKVVTGDDYRAAATNQLYLGHAALLVITLLDNKEWDLLVSNCYAHDGVKKDHLLLIDEKGCSVAVQLISQLHKLQNSPVAGQSDVFAAFRAFKFPDRPNVYFNCDVQLCRGTCIQSSCEPGTLRRKRGVDAAEFEERLDNADFDVPIISPPIKSGVTHTHVGKRMNVSDVVTAPPPSSSLSSRNMSEHIKLFRGVQVIIPPDMMQLNGENDDFLRFAQAPDIMLPFATTSPCIPWQTLVWAVSSLSSLLLLSILATVVTCVRYRRLRLLRISSLPDMLHPSELPAVPPRLPTNSGRGSSCSGMTTIRRSRSRPRKIFY